MREQACILLAIMRKANEQQVWMPLGMGQSWLSAWALRSKERMEIGEILKADMREKFVSHPLFAEINAALERFPKLA